MTIYDGTKDSNEGTEMINDMANAISCGIRFLQNVQEIMDVFIDENGPSMILKYSVYKDNYIKARSRGAKIRFVTEITKDNIHHCKELKRLLMNSDILMVSKDQ
ncbi:MAG: hypothetical protein M3Z01_09180 [Thermoproteota archaeon]|nr:hypothetical protein [Thermoproteota archaeon]